MQVLILCHSYFMTTVISEFFFSGGAKSKMPPTLNSIEKSQQNHLQHKIRLARTISREPEVKESSVDDDDEDDDGQVSAV